MNTHKSSMSLAFRIVGTTALLSLLALMLFGYFEPAVTQAVDDTHTVSQSVTAEIIFDTSATDVTMGPSIPGLSGGTANGQTDVRVVTNNPNGYNMTVAFANAVAMQGDVHGGQILNYTEAATGTRDFDFTIGANTGEFGYTVEAETAADLDPSFLDDGATCGTGALDSVDQCWAAPSTTPELAINRTTFTDANGASTTIKYRVQLAANPDPLIPADSYTATTTLTAVMN